ncbi:MAG: hypothetical protein ABI255_04970 [Microbacteriaceae bacterium]
MTSSPGRPGAGPHTAGQGRRRKREVPEELQVPMLRVPEALEVPEGLQMPEGL